MTWINVPPIWVNYHNYNYAWGRGDGVNPTLGSVVHNCLLMKLKRGDGLYVTDDLQRLKYERN